MLYCSIVELKIRDPCSDPAQLMRDAKGKPVTVTSIHKDFTNKQNALVAVIQKVLNNGNFKDFFELSTEIVATIKRDIVDRKMSVAAGCKNHYSAAALTLGYGNFEVGNGDLYIKMTFY